MANRILRDTTDSEPVNNLSWQAEVFFYRLMMKVDDYGVFHANPKILKSLLFPLRSDSIREADINRWVAECNQSALITLYVVNSKPYVRIENFGQRLRSMKGKFPLPTIDNNCQPETETNLKPETEEETESESEKAHELFGKIFFELKNSQRWIDDLCRIYKKSLEYLHEKLTEFLNDLKAKDDYYKGVSEIKKHFVNWLKKEIEKEKNSAKKENGKQNNIGTKAGQQHPLQNLNDLSNGLLQSLTGENS